MNSNPSPSPLPLVLIMFAILSGFSERFFCHSCEFPPALQTNVTGRGWTRDWQSRIKEQFTEFTLKIEIGKKTIRTVATDPSSKSHTRVCARTVEGNKYIVIHEEAGQTGLRFSCIQFVFRSPDVFQIRSAPLSESMDASLCGDAALRLDKWLVVDKGKIGRDRQPCPLQGGFSILVFDKLRQRGVCDAWKGEIRMESECAAGDGLIFYFRTQRCVPEDLFMYSTQATVCLANWREGSFTFSLLRHSVFPYSWVLRYPTAARDTFTIYLFKDLIADPSEQVTETFNYLRLDTTRDRTPDLGTFCSDDYEICSTLKAPCAKVSPQIAMACPQTCGICTQSSPRMCSLRPEWVGHWTDVVNRTVSVNSTTIQVHRQAGSATSHEHRYRCVKWQRTPSGSSAATAVDPLPVDSRSTDEMLVTVLGNGCKPRYTCARLVKQSPTFLYVKLSQPMLWPLMKSPEDPIDCRAFSFEQTGSYPGSDGRPSTAWPQHLMLYAHDRQDSVDCRLPTIYTDYHSKYKNGLECSNASLAETPSGKGLVLHQSGCTSGSTSSPSYSTLPDRTVRFTCLGTSTLGDSADLVIITNTLTAGNVTEIFCWFFPKPPTGLFYQQLGAHCHHQAVKTGTKSDQVQTFHGVFGTKFPKSTPSASSQIRPVTPSYRLHQNKIQPSGGGQNNPTQRTRKLMTSLSPQTTPIAHSPSTEESESLSVNPFVWVVAVVLFAILQIFFFCKRS